MLAFFGVFGNPIKHSKSPFLHNYTFDKCAETMGFYGIYRRILLENANLLRHKFLELGLSGANITLPFKEEAFSQCDEVEGIAVDIEACNTWVKNDKGIIGYNTDAMGFYQCLSGYDIKNALVIGAGGAAKAVAMILKNNNIPTTIINRTESKLRFFIQKGFECYVSADFSQYRKPYSIIINTTSAGLKDTSLPCEKSILDTLLTEAHYAFDLIYGTQTPFLSLAKKQNLIVQDGRDMLVFQAALAYELFCENINPNYKQTSDKHSFVNSTALMKEIDKILL